MKTFRIYDADGTTTILEAKSVSESSEKAIEAGYRPVKIVEL